MHIDVFACLNIRIEDLCIFLSIHIAFSISSKKKFMTQSFLYSICTLRRGRGESDRDIGSKPRAAGGNINNYNG